MIPSRVTTPFTKTLMDFTLIATNKTYDGPYLFLGRATPQTS